MSGVGSRWWTVDTRHAGSDMKSANVDAVLQSSTPRELMASRGVGIENSQAPGVDNF
jgi:hypothetical protein